MASVNLQVAAINGFNDVSSCYKMASVMLTVTYSEIKAKNGFSDVNVSLF